MLGGQQAQGRVDTAYGQMGNAWLTTGNALGTMQQNRAGMEYNSGKDFSNNLMTLMKVNSDVMTGGNQAAAEGESK